MSTVGSIIERLPFTTTPPITPDFYVWPGMTHLTLENESLSLGLLLEGSTFSGYCLASTLLVRLLTSRSGVLATVHLAVDEYEEYGYGQTDEEAIRDLLTSLLECLESLETREGQLGEPALADLKKLRQMFRPSS